MSLNNSPADVKRSLARRWAIDYIEVINYKKLKVYKKNGKLLVDLKYEDRRPFFGNMEVVAAFNDAIQLAP